MNNWKYRPKLSGILFIAGVAASIGFAPQVSANSSAEYFRARANTNALPSLLSNADRSYYRSVFSAIDAKDWNRAERMLNERGDGPLHQVAWAEYYLASGSPRVDVDRIANWLAKGTYLPQAEQLIALGQKRGLTYVPALPEKLGFVRQSGASKRILPEPTNDGTMPSSTANAIRERIKNDDPDGAQSILAGIEPQLSAEARSEWRQRIAWSYYIENRDAQALAIARTARQGGAGPWQAEADWTAGLAAWRLGNCDEAAQYFARTGQTAYNEELRAAGYYWASRALTRCRFPEKAAEQLRGAAQLNETLYGMLAREQLGQVIDSPGESPDFSNDDWQRLRNEPNVRVVLGLTEIGRDNLADEVLRYQARIGNPSEYESLSRLARELGLPSTQLWMAHNSPEGGKPDSALRYPAPRWQPVNGWKIDPALAYAHTLQESVFRAGAVSPAGARGLMQIMPAAARDHSGTLGYSGRASDLNKPEVNLAFGQEHLKMLRDNQATGGLLPKIMAAYNAGLSPISRWNSEIRDQDDPLLYMESIPYWETRGYVAIVLRNYWMYERQAGADSKSRTALAQAKWPTFPELSNGNGLRLTHNDGRYSSGN